MSDLFRFPAARHRHPEVEAWFLAGCEGPRLVARRWFGVVRNTGPDVREVLHDGRPTACVTDAAFAYVEAFSGHINLGFFQGASLADPRRLLAGEGKRMRHVKIFWGQPVDEAAITALVAGAYQDMRARLGADDA